LQPGEQQDRHIAEMLRQIQGAVKHLFLKLCGHVRRRFPM
jgi:hypothetical protein